jgi:hypothetical protein
MNQRPIEPTALHACGSERRGRELRCSGKRPVQNRAHRGARRSLALPAPPARLSNRAAGSSQVTHIEISVRSDILRPTQEDIARRLHDALTLDHPLALMARKFRRQPLEHRLAGFPDLQE